MAPRYSPGRILMETLAAKKMTQDDLGILISINRRHIHNICRDYAGISPQMGVLFANAGVAPLAELAEVKALEQLSPAEQWAALSAAHRATRLSQGKTELEQPPKVATKAHQARRTEARRKAARKATAKKKPAAATVESEE